MATIDEYLQHKDDCNAAAWEQRKAVGQVPTYQRPACTCGLDAVTKKAKPPTLLQLSARINAHLKRFEADPVINARDPAKRGGMLPYYNAYAGYGGGNKIFVGYISFQGRSFLTRDEATRYLAKLDAGFVGRHHEALRETT